MTEEWRPIARYEGRYDVSNLGRVRSWVYSGRRQTMPRVRACSVNQHGYEHVTLMSDNGRSSTVTVHVLVLEAFRGRRPAGLVGCHLDGDKRNNAIRNLRWVTQAENIAHKVEHGTQLFGERHAQAKLDAECVRSIRALRASGKTLKSLAEKFGVSLENIRLIAKRETWRHVR